MATKQVYVCMDGDGDYVACLLKGIKPTFTHGVWWQRNEKGAQIHSWLLDYAGCKLFRHLNLAPGGGPVRVTITVERDDRGGEGDDKVHLHSV